MRPVSVTLASCASFVFALAMSACSGPEYPNCSNDSQCQRDGHHEFCVMNHCQQCRTSGDCPAGQACNAGRCEAPAARPECTGDSSCAPGHQCQAGHCVAAPMPTGDLSAHSTDGGSCTFPTPHFGFDNANLSDADRTALQSTAECLRREGTTHYVLIGRADPRGTSEYNLALGARRSHAVASYLVALGIAEPRLAASSEGSEGASGHDEAGFANDRRVDPNRRETPASGH